MKASVFLMLSLRNKRWLVHPIKPLDQMNINRHTLGYLSPVKSTESLGKYMCYQVKTHKFSAIF